MKKNFKNRSPFQGRGPNAMWVLLLILGIGLGYLFWYNSVHKERELINFSTFLKQVDENNVARVAINDQQVFGELTKPVIVNADGRVKKVKLFETVIVSPDSLWTKLHEHNIVMDVYPPDKPNWFVYVLMLFAPFILVLFYLFVRQNQGSSGSKIFTVGKSRARFFSPNTIKIKFKDVAGAQEAKEDLKDIVDFLKNPESFKRLGAKIPRGVLLTGAPGNGKTMLAKAVAGEASCPFFSVSGSDFVEVFVGVGASRVRDLFLQAKRNAPCIIFIDELDAVGRHRGTGIGGGNDEREQTLNQLLAEMDGFATEPGEVIVLAATNRPDVLDKALMRPGRFDRKVEVPYPDLASREQILKIHAKAVKLSPDVDLARIARGTARFSGADLANLINEAALIASKNAKSSVELEDFESARDKILVGAERKTLTMTEDDIKQTAYHEAGHTLVNVLLPDTHPLHKVTILSRGSALGITWYLPEGDQVSENEIQMLSEIMVCLGGRIAEEIIFGDFKRSSGASSDLKAATRIARDMVKYYGMSDLGPISLADSQMGDREYSEAMAEKVDSEVSRILNECYDKARALVLDNKDKLIKLSEELIKKETLDASEVYTLLEITPKPTSSFVKNKEGLAQEETIEGLNEEVVEDASLEEVIKK